MDDDDAFLAAVEADEQAQRDKRFRANADDVQIVKAVPSNAPPPPLMKPPAKAPPLQTSVTKPSHARLNQPTTLSVFKPKGVRPNHIDGFDEQAGRTWVYPINYDIRNYQFEMCQRAFYHNLLVVLPTGLGKTFIAAVIMYNFYRWYPQRKVLFAAPTRPLVAQQMRACYEVMGVPQDHMIEMTGKMSPDRRREYWQTRRMFFLTPQVAKNDLDRPDPSIRPEDVICVVFDEAHRATGKHAYCEIMRQMQKRSIQFRVLALTATPGKDVEAVGAVVRDLAISDIAYRTEESMDVQQFAHRRIETLIVLPPTAELRGFICTMSGILQPFMERLRINGALPSYCNLDNLTFFWIRQIATEFRQKASATPWSRNHVEIDCAVLGPLITLREKLVMYGLATFVSSVHQLVKGKFNPRARIEINRNQALNKLYNDVCGALHIEPKLPPCASKVDCDKAPDADLQARLERSFTGGYVYSHPKLEKLEALLREHFEQHKVDLVVNSHGGGTTRALIFAEFRYNVLEIVDMLKRNEPLIKCAPFIGQGRRDATSKRGRQSALEENCHFESDDDGRITCQRQSEQLEVVRQFRQGQLNTLVATCVGEEGLDIGEIDLIVCYDTQKSAIRAIQRRGRTGRKRDGRVITLCSEGMEERRHNKAKQNRKEALDVVDRAKNRLGHVGAPQLIPNTVSPLVHKQIMRRPDFSESQDAAVQRRPRAKKNKQSIEQWLRPTTSRRSADGRPDSAHVKYQQRYMCDKGVEAYNLHYRIMAPESEPVVPHPIVDRRWLLHGGDGVVEPEPTMSLSSYSVWQTGELSVGAFPHSDDCRLFVRLNQMVDDYRLDGADDGQYEKELLEYNAERRAHSGGLTEMDAIVIDDDDIADVPEPVGRRTRMRVELPSMTTSNFPHCVFPMTPAQRRMLGQRQFLSKLELDSSNWQEAGTSDAASSSSAGDDAAASRLLCRILGETRSRELLPSALGIMPPSEIARRRASAQRNASVNTTRAAELTTPAVLDDVLAVRTDSRTSFGHCAENAGASLIKNVATPVVVDRPAEGQSTAFIGLANTSVALTDTDDNWLMLAMEDSPPRMPSSALREEVSIPLMKAAVEVERPAGTVTELVRPNDDDATTAACADDDDAWMLDVANQVEASDDNGTCAVNASTPSGPEEAIGDRTAEDMELVAEVLRETRKAREKSAAAELAAAAAATTRKVLNDTDAFLSQMPDELFDPPAENHSAAPGDDDDDALFAAIDLDAIERENMPQEPGCDEVAVDDDDDDMFARIDLDAIEEENAIGGSPIVLEGECVDSPQHACLALLKTPEPGAVIPIGDTVIAQTVIEESPAAIPIPDLSDTAITTPTVVRVRAAPPRVGEQYQSTTTGTGASDRCGAIGGLHGPALPALVALSRDDMATACHAAMDEISPKTIHLADKDSPAAVMSTPPPVVKCYEQPARGDRTSEQRRLVHASIGSPLQTSTPLRGKRQPDAATQLAAKRIASEGQGRPLLSPILLANARSSAPPLQSTSHRSKAPFRPVPREERLVLASALAKPLVVGEATTATTAQPRHSPLTRRRINFACEEDMCDVPIESASTSAQPPLPTRALVNRNTGVDNLGDDKPTQDSPLAVCRPTTNMRRLRSKRTIDSDSDDDDAPATVVAGRAGCSKRRRDNAQPPAANPIVEARPRRRHNDFVMTQAGASDDEHGGADDEVDDQYEIDSFVTHMGTQADPDVLRAIHLRHELERERVSDTASQFLHQMRLNMGRRGNHLVANPHGANDVFSQPPDPNDAYEVDSFVADDGEEVVVDESQSTLAY